jgi:hypothetical protein
MDRANAIDLLKGDHERMKALFRRFEKASSLPEKKRLADEAVLELKVHSLLEEEIFYPAIRQVIEDDSLMNLADEEHHAVKVLLAELSTMQGTESHFDGKFTVLTENVVHHMREEEEEMFPKAEMTDIDFDKLGVRMQRRKEDLLRGGVPVNAEDEMVSATQGKNDSSAQNAHRAVRAPRRKNRA